jgi:hypothetical protein
MGDANAMTPLVKLRRAKAKNKKKKTKMQMWKVNFQVLTHLCYLIFCLCLFVFGLLCSK